MTPRDPGAITRDDLLDYVRNNYPTTPAYWVAYNTHEGYYLPYRGGHMFVFRLMGITECTLTDAEYDVIRDQVTTPDI